MFEWFGNDRFYGSDVCSDKTCLYGSILAMFHTLRLRVLYASLLTFVFTSFDVEAQTIVQSPAVPTWNTLATEPLLDPGIAVGTLGVISPTSPFIPTPPYLGAAETDQVIKLYDTRNVAYPNPPATGRPTITPDEYHHHNWDIGSIGNVYGIAIDNDRNIYVTASTHYGAGYFTGAGTVGFGGIGAGQLPDTALLDNNTGVLNDTTAAGAVYRIDAVTGNVTMLVSLPQQSSPFTHENCENPAETTSRNTGPALGNVVYDSVHNQLFVSNFEDGRIYRLSLTGAVLSTFDPFAPDNGAPGLAPDPKPYGMAVNANGSKLYFGTLDFTNTFDPGLYAVDLDASGDFSGAEVNQNASLTSDLNFSQNVGGGFTSNPWTSYSDLTFTPRGELMIGVRTGCGATAPNLATSHNHGGTFYKLIQDSAGLYNAAAPGTVGADGNFPVHFIGDTLGPDDGYGGVGIFDKGDGTYDYFATSGDVGIEEGPHGFLVFPDNYSVGDNVSTYFIAQGASIPGLSTTNPPAGVSDYKGVFGDIEVLGTFLDWGDAPDSYNTDNIPPDPTDINDIAGPAHILTDQNITIGSLVDFESSGIVSSAADGDDNAGSAPDDEDGLSAKPSFFVGQTPTFTVPVSNPLTNPDVTLYAWLDLDGNGDFTGPGEFVASSPIPASATPASVVLNFPVVPNTILNDITSFLRLRVTSDVLTASDFEGYASNGEVEDHPVMLMSLMSLGNVVWMDNGAGVGGIVNDGIKQAGEMGIAGVDIELYTAGETPGSDVPFQTTTTAADGSYIFNALQPGTYFVHIPASEFAVGQPLVEKVSTAGQGAADNTNDDDVSEDGDDNESDGVSSSLYVLTADNEPTGEGGFIGTSGSTSDDDNTNLTVDFGFYEPVSIGNLVWMDNGNGAGGVSNDGIKQLGEMGVSGVVVQLYSAADVPGVDAPANSTITLSDGSYIFDSIIPGSYFVHIPASEFGSGEPLIDKVSTTGQGADDNINDDSVAEDGDDAEVDGVSSGVYVLLGGSEPTGETGFIGAALSTQDDNNTNLTADFGFYQPVSVGNLVWMDNGAGSGVANDGIKQAGEIGVPGVNVELYAQGDTPGVDLPVTTTTTALDGSYILTTSPGLYFVHIPASEFATSEPLAEKVSTTGQGTADNINDDNLAEDGDDNEADGVSSGVYDLQPNLEPMAETGFLGSTASPNDDNNTNLTVDFGFHQPVSIGNLVWMDNGAGGGVANDGIKQAAEPGVSGVVIQLYRVGSTPGVTAPVAQTMTLADGSYVFDSFPPGSYFVHIPANEFAASEPLAGKVSSTGQGVADNVNDDHVAEDGDDVEIDGVSSGTYVLLGGSEPTGELGFSGVASSTQDDNNTNFTADFGFYIPVSIGNVVWMDNGAGSGGVSNDGIKQTGEMGVADVVVELYEAGDTPGADAPMDTTTTAADGSYILSGPEGDYFVHIPVSEFGVGEPLENKVSSTGQGGVDNVEDDDVSEDGDDNEADGVSTTVYTLRNDSEPIGESGFAGTTVSPSDDDNTNSTADFGFYQPVSVGNLVWMDNGAGAGGVSDDGIKQAGEAGIAGVVVELYRSGDVPGVNPSAASTVTAADGSYFLTAAPGAYFVHIPSSEFMATEPLEDKVSSAGQGVADNVDDDDVAEDGDDNEVDGVSSGLFDLQPNDEPTIETGFSGSTVAPTDDNNTNASVDFGFYQPVSIGNLVWMDNGDGIGGVSNDGIVNGSEIGVANVVVEIFRAGLTPGIDTPSATTVTAADGSYVLTVPPGEYFVHIPTGEFAASEPLENKVSSTGQGAADNTADDDVAEDGDDTVLDGVSSGVYDLQPNLEPTGESGFVGITTSPVDDNNTNLTADFGFYQPVAIGNLVFMDNGLGGGIANNGRIDGGEIGISGVVVELYKAGDTPTMDAPTASTVTNIDGSYILLASPGEYFVHIPASEFTVGEPLAEKVSTTGQGVGDAIDDDADENGDDNETDGVSSNVYDLQPGMEPTSETGFPGLTVSPLNDNDTNLTVDFGFYQAVSVGNLVWMDNGAGTGGVSNDGIKQIGESGVPGVVVELYSAGSNPISTTAIASTMTQSDGSYIFDSTVPGSYFIHIPASEFAATEPLENKVSTTGQGGADNADDDDAADDGDDTESDGVSSPVYQLLGGSEPTGESGFIGTAVSTQDDNNTNSTVDFGFYQPVSIGNVVFMDNGAGTGTSNNGILDGSEVGIPGVVVELYQSGDTPGVNAPADSTITAADGSYILTSSPGRYFVHIPVAEFASAEPLEDKVSSTGQGATDNAADDDVSEDGDDTLTDGVSTGDYDLQPNLEPIGETGFVGTTIAPTDDNNTNSTADFGFYEPVSVGNLIFMDNGVGGGVANNGIFDGAEVGISGVIVELYAVGDTPSFDPPADTTVTAADGSYVLSSSPGEYFVHIPASEFAATEPLEEKVSTTGQGVSNNTDDDDVAEDGDDVETDGVSSAVYDLQPNTEPTGETGFIGSTISPSDDNSHNSTIDFGFYQPVSLGNVIWMDNGAGGGVSNDGIINGMETGVAFVDVELYSAGDTPGTDAPFAVTTSNIDGSYLFDSIAPGRYFVHIPVGEFVAGQPLHDKVSTSGQAATDNTQDDSFSEDGDDDESDGVSSGVYTLLGGTEPISEAGFTGIANSTQDDNNTNLTADFAFYQPVAVGNVVFMDNGAGGGVSNNGILDGGEVGIDDVVIELYSMGDVPGASAPVDTTVTAADGSYILTAPPGPYFVHIPVSEFAVGEPLVDKVSTSGQGTADNNNDDDVAEDGDDIEADGVSSAVFDLQPGLEPTGESGFTGSTVSPVDDDDTNSTVDFAFYEPVSIGNLIWIDNGAGGGVANDGIVNGSEAGVSGVEVELYKAGDSPLTDSPVDSTTTASDGSYILTASPGRYFVHVPVSEFGVGEPLLDKVSTTGQAAADNTQDDDFSEDGDDNEADGVSTRIYDLQVNLEPSNETGFMGAAVSPTDDNNTNVTADFGFYEPVSLGNLIWFDNGTSGGIFNDGVKQAGEPGVSDVEIELYAEGDVPGVAVPLEITTTASDGSYMFDSIAPGRYFVHIPVGEFMVGEPLQNAVSSTGQGMPDNDNDDDVAEDGDDNEIDGVSSGVYALMSGLEPTAETGFVGVSVSSQDDNNTNSTADFAFLVPGSVGSFVWIDTNGDGIQQPSEPPLSGAQISLTVDLGAGFVPAADFEGVPLPTLTVGVDGLYSFAGLPFGDYKVTVVPPAGFFPSAVQTTTSNDDSENDSNIATQPIAGTYDSGVFTLSSGAEPIETNAFRGDLSDAANSGSLADLSGNMTIDFGFVQPASLGNYVWLDQDRDGVQDANEDGLANVTVNLYQDTDGDGTINGTELTTPIASVTTGPNGGYLFPDLTPGVVYQTGVDVSSLPTGLVQTFDEDDGLGANDSLSGPITLDPNEFHDTADFGYAPPDGVGSVGDTIWVDADDDGVQDPGEPGIAGVEVSITPPPDVNLGAGLGVAITTVTDASGKYLFTNLPLNESYIVDVNTATLPAGYTSSVSGLGDPDVRDGNSGAADNQTTVTVTTDNPINLDSDFGYLPPAGQNNSVGDTVWIDLDGDGNGPAGAGNGSDANEQPLPGVTVALVNRMTGVVVATTLTNANGMYVFMGIPDGSYEVRVTDQNAVLAGLTQTSDNDDPANPGAYVPSTPNASLVDLDSAGAVNVAVVDLNQDFGYVDSSPSSGTGSIGDTIFFDSNESGEPDAGEGIEGVVVQLFAPGPDGVIGGGDDVLIASTTTDENGNYLFTGLDTSDTGPNPGTEYRVVVDIASLPNGGAGWSNSVDPDTAGTGNSESVTSLTSADPVDLDQDFGYIGDGNNIIRGTVWPDTDGDGTQEEAGSFGGVTIELRDQDGNVISTTTTDSDGNYEFTNLPDGIYTVVVTDDDNVLNGFEHTDSPNGSSDTSDETSKDDTGYVVDLDSTGSTDEPVIDDTGDFGYQPVITNPISLGSFTAQAQDDGSVNVEWVTQTEVGNLGFYVYARVDGEWQRLNTTLIVGQGDSVHVQRYALTVQTDAKAFALGDIDLTGKETLHGPFKLGGAYGTVGERRSIEWQTEKQERLFKQQQRQQRELKQQQYRIKQQRSVESPPLNVEPRRDIKPVSSVLIELESVGEAA